MSVLISFLVYCCLFARSPQVGLLYPRSNVSVVAPVGWISSQVLYKSISALIEPRIKKIMKADEDVKMISAEAPVVFAKACEMFILELTLRSWIHTEENKRRTLQKNDIAAAIGRTDIFDFLVDIVPRDEFKDEGLVIPRAAGAVPFMGPGDNVPSYYYVAQQAPNMAAYAPPTQQMRSKAPAPPPHGSS